MKGDYHMDHDLKNKVKSHYGRAAKKVSSAAKASCGCGCGPECCSGPEDNAHLYTKEYLDSLPEDAIRASLGCANPIFLANLQKGETVLDLGSGGGIDVLISTKLVGPEGMVYGLDMTDEMLELANRNKEKMGVTNAAFLKGYIEEIPLENESVDVITSNCVINLCEDKEIAMKEAYRVLKKGGRLAIADIVQQREVPEDIKKSTEMWLGCIAGALDAETYRDVLEKAGFSCIEIEAVNPYLDGAYAGSHIKAVK
jgi:ubiquinone/menaquinone biosynthesis C-methylase UbiE